MKKILFDWLKKQEKESYEDLLKFDIDEIGEFANDERIQFINAIRETLYMPLLTFEEFKRDKDKIEDDDYCDNPSCLKQGCKGECEQ